jgi:hypothetical protein
MFALKGIARTAISIIWMMKRRRPIMTDCTKCKHAIWDCEEYYNTQKKWWFVDGCRKDNEPEDCEEFEEEEA